MDRARPPRDAPPRRRDAVETRERILRVAGEALTGRSPTLPFDEVARRAGVSRATVYRHFPDRRALTTAVVERSFRALRRALAEREPIAFRDLLRSVLVTAASLRRLADLVDELPARDRRRHRRMLIDVLAPAFRRAQADGELRPDVEPADLDPILRALHAAGRKPDGEAAALRLLDVLVDGLFVAGPRCAHPACVSSGPTRR